MCFLVRALPKVRDQIRKQFFDKVLHNYCSNFFVERFVPKKGVPKNGFPIVFFLSDLGGGGAVFFAKHPGICPSFSGNMSET